VLHWDGVQWRSVSTDCGPGLSGITALSASNIWAIGGTTSCRWNGLRWTAIRVDVRPGLNLLDIDGRTANDLWAVGHTARPCGEGVCFSGEVQRWNGTRWTSVPTGAAPLESVVAVRRTDVWAVGPGALPELWHFDGTTWSDAPAPDIAPGWAELNAVDATGSDDLWAAGTARTGTLMGSTLVLHARSTTSGAVMGDTDVAGAVVSWFGPETGAVESDAFGNYDIGGLAVGRYTLIATHPGCSPASASVRVRAGTTIVLDISPNC
jgi:hypothetical protein